ncbi:Gfo/Idh/MocA family protein [Nakamurella sp.]|uniref:Gfo/Idh/MocA family protein n=1 Tax=Nakamurella sp. TaxID=1869182 RepID=UPI003B3AEABF
MTPVFPPARTPNPLDAPPLRWGVLAPGRIAAAFVTAVSRYTRQRVVAVGSRSLDRASAFAAEHGIDRAVGSYQELVDDPAVDVVYVASPHSEHAAQAGLAVAAGKHVLVEKAFTRNAAQARHLVAAARAAGVLAVEAMWTRFLTQTDVLARLLADGVLGEVTTVLADHGQHFAPDPQSRLFAPELAGGALLDLGIYPISFASFVLGAPDSVVATGSRTATGVDAQVSMTLSTGTAQACLNTTLLAATPTTASVSGTAGSVEITGPFYAPASMILTTADGRAVREPDPVAGHLGLCFEAAHVAQLIADGATESPLLPLDETVRILETVDEIRRQVGVRYPGE